MPSHNKQKKDITINDLKVIQMDILEVIDEFCEEHNIRYSLACGTLLGAIRHKGYIPWDDDIDIYIPRPDYKRLIAEFPKIFKGRYKISSIERDPQCERPFAKAYDDLTIIKEFANVKEEIGVNIDIFPVDEVPIGKKWEIYNKKRKRQVLLYISKRVRVCSTRSLSKNLTLLFLHAITFFYSSRQLAIKINRLAQVNNGKGYDHYFECCQGILQKQPFKKSLFNNLIYIPFEDRQFKAFADYDHYLKKGFGNYMEMPPIEKRVTHHIFKAYWK